MNAKKRLEIFQKLSEAIPNPETELNYNNNFELLVAVILSAQATDRGVNKATDQLFKVANTPKKMADLGVQKLISYIKTIGLFNTKAKNIIKTSELLLEKHQGNIPQNQKELEALPGVGRKTANVVLNTAFNQPTIAVDTHVFRLSNRTGIAQGRTVLEVEKKLLKVIPKTYLMDAHHLLILHGRYTCIARTPRCSACCIYDLCEFKEKSE